MTKTSSQRLPPPRSILVTRFHRNEWRFDFPRITPEVYELFHEALDNWESGNSRKAEKDIRLLTEGFPEFIDAFHHLALILDETQRSNEAFNVWQYAVDIGLKAFPKTFTLGRHKLSWGILDNRPFLRAYHSWGLQHFDRGDIHSALSIFKNILAMNPNDNQGIRGLLVDCFFRIGQPEEVLRICRKFPDDAMEGILYGCPLALFQIGQPDHAKRALADAIRVLPLVAKELIKTRHPIPRGIHPGFVTHGGKDQAYYYWQQQGDHWKNTPGALELVKECLYSVKKTSKR